MFLLINLAPLAILGGEEANCGAQMRCVIVLFLGLSVAGCGSAHTLGGAAIGGLGGAYGGSLFGQGQGRLAATAGGALLGAGIGGYLGSFFDQVHRNSSLIQGLSERPADNPETVYPAPAIYSVPPQTGYPQSYQVPMNCQVVNNYVTCSSR